MAAMSLLTVLATLPSGAVPVDLTLSQLGQYLRDHYHTDVETTREDRHRLRDELYRDGGLGEMNRLIDSTFDHDSTRLKRKQWARWARFNNVTKRIVNELSTVYQEPAVRSVEDEAENAKYQMALALCRMHDVARRFNRMLNLHRAALAVPSVRTMPDGKRRPVIDVVTPANARLIVHPNEPSRIVGIAIRIRPRMSAWQTGGSSLPAWLVWSAAELFMLTEGWEILGGTFQTHPLGRIPAVFASLDLPTELGPWPGTSGEDLVAADMAIWFTAILLLKESKSATRQPIVTGDASAAARGQVQDSDNGIELPDGTAVTMVDMSMDLAMFRDTADHILEHVANNYGMSAAQIKHQGVQSAEARELMRVPLRELRREQQIVLRDFERELAEVLSTVLAADLPELAFKTDGWRINFGEGQTPLTPKEELERFEHERRLGLTNTVDYMMEQDPDLDEEAALDQVERNVEMELKRNRLMRPLQRVNGSMGAALPAPEGEVEDEAANGPPGQNGRSGSAAPSTAALG